MKELWTWRVIMITNCPVCPFLYWNFMYSIFGWFFPSPRPSSPPYLTSFIFSLYIFPSKPNNTTPKQSSKQITPINPKAHQSLFCVLVVLRALVWACLGVWSIAPGHSTVENWFCFCQQVSTANSFLVRGEPWCQLPLSVLRHCLTWTCGSCVYCHSLCKLMCALVLLWLEDGFYGVIYCHWLSHSFHLFCWTAGYLWVELVSQKMSQ